LAFATVAALNVPARNARRLIMSESLRRRQQA
jgi:hypothetical protein